MAAAPKVTILIPTRERAETLVHSMRTVLMQPEQDIEVLVSDNFSGPEVKEVVDSFADSRVRYIRTPERLGMTEHWNFAIKQVQGEWVMVLGDDDGLLPGAIGKMLEIAAKHPDIKLITGTKCYYTWPSATSDGKPKFRLVTGKGYKICDSLRNLKHNMMGKIEHLPTIYTGGFVHRDIIAEISAKTPGGVFFNSIIPDVYSGMAMSSVTVKYIYCWQPLAIAGVSRHSNGHQHKNKTRAEMKNLDFYKESNLTFLPTLGDAQVESMQILLYESFLRSSHLRTDDFGVTMPQQLEVSIANAGGRVRESVIEYCRDIAKINNIDFEPILQRALAQVQGNSFKRLLMRLTKKIPGVGHTVRKNIDSSAMLNVMDAAEIAAKRLTA